MLWKQLFFENYLQAELESFDSSSQDPHELILKLKAGEDHVFNLQIRQFLSHANVEIIFGNLPNLASFVGYYACILCIYISTFRC